jgi:hypothetical protein
LAGLDPSLERACCTRCNITEIARARRCIGKRRAGQEAFRLVGAIAGSEGRTFLLSRDDVDLAGVQVSMAIAASLSSAWVAAGMA